MKIVVPGNLLLFGEYAITYPGGLGIAAATKEKLIIHTAPSTQFRLTGKYGNSEYEWTHGKAYPNRLLESVLKEVNAFPNQHIHIDSSEFYYQDGTKKGFGSSAATTIGLICALKPELFYSKEELIKEALKQHRSFQGGKGSGYDIFTSVYGGVGLFEKHAFPTWKSLSQDLYSNFYLVKGKTPCSTQDSLCRLENFACNHPAKLKKFLKVSNKLVAGLTTSLRLFGFSALLNRWINAQLSQSQSMESLKVKSLGAGGEIGISLDETLSKDPLQISPMGIQCLA